METAIPSTRGAPLYGIEGLATAGTANEDLDPSLIGSLVLAVSMNRQ